MIRKTAKYGIMLAAAQMLDDVLINRCHECGAKVKNAVGEPYSRHRVKPRGWPNPLCDQIGRIKS